MLGPSVVLATAFAAVALIVAGVLAAPLLMLASRLVLKKCVPFGQSFLIVCACLLIGALITWPVHAGIGDVPEGRALAQAMGWAISFGVMTALVDKATAAGLTRSATVAALNFVFYLAIWLVATVTLMGVLAMLMKKLLPSATLINGFPPL